MVIRQLYAAQTPQAHLGAIDPNVDLNLPPLSVRAYAVGWASYQSPAANAVLTELNRALRSMGFTRVRSDGVIDGNTVAAVKLVASVASIAGYSGIALSSGAGGTVGYAGTVLRYFTTAESIARGGMRVRLFLTALAASSNFNAIMHAVNASPTQSAPNVPSPSVNTAPGTVVTNTPPTQFPTGGGAGPIAPLPPTNPLPPTKPKWPWLIAGGILAVGVITTAVIVSGSDGSGK